MTKKTTKSPRVLIVTPEITYLPQGMGNMANHLRAKGGGLADVSATLVATLFEKGVDVHVALPHYRKMFGVNSGQFLHEELKTYKSKIPDDRIHLAEDRVFYYQDQVYGAYEDGNNNIALAFQREVINNIVPRVRPDLIHCNDWMTGLIPAMGRKMNIPCLFTLHNIHSVKMTLEKIETSGIDAAEFWQYLYFMNMPRNYEETRSWNKVDFLATGVFSAHFINAVSSTFLEEIINGEHWSFVDEHLRSEIAGKFEAGCAVGIMNSPDPKYNPRTDNALTCQYDEQSHRKGKRENKRALQERLGLDVIDNAPVFFWPSRLDPVQKGCQLLTDILYETLKSYWKRNLQLVVVANGPYQRHFHDIVRHHDLYRRVAVCDYDDFLARQAYAASDFILMPSKFEPCGLPQMICQIYGSMPIARDVGGIHDTVRHFNPVTDEGNGFLFENYDGSGLRWAIDEAMSFFKLPKLRKAKIISRIMTDSVGQFNHQVTAQQYLDSYEKMIARPMLTV